DPFAVCTDKQPLDASVFAQLDIAIGKSFVETAGLRIHLASPGVREGVPRRFCALEPFVDIDAERKRGGVQPDPLQALPDFADRGLIGYGLKRVGGRMRGLRRIESD